MKLFLGLLLLVASLWAGQPDNYDKGMDAYRAGDFKKAFSLFKPLAKKGGIGAQYMLGLMYNLGQGVKPNCQKGVYWYELSAKQGDDWSLGNLISIYSKGYGNCKKNPRKAIKWLKFKIKKYNKPSDILELGYIYDSELKNYKQAFKWYKLVAKQGHAVAQYNLGIMYYLGEGVKANKYKAYKWWSKAAKQGNKGAQKNLNILCRQSPEVCK